VIDASPRTLVLLPGLDGSGVFFRPLVRRLPRGWDAVVASYPARDELGYDELMPRARALLPTDRPFVLLGESFSGPLSIRLAAEAPPGLQALVLCATFARCPVRGRPSWLARLSRPLLFQPFRALSILRGRVGAGSGSVDLTRRALAEVTPAVLARRLRAVLQVDVSAELRACPAPILYLQGTRDRVVGAHNARYVQAVRPDAKIERIPSSHMVLQRNPEAAIFALSAFLSSARPRSRTSSTH
jgi:pimeloyl-[acyl-carrier protein] methyl ester esterase